jgi:hypothetical protein
MSAAMTPKRVRDQFAGHLGWAVESFPRNKYRVEWDDPTENQYEARPTIPGKVFVWADEQSKDAK